MPGTYSTARVLGNLAALGALSAILLAAIWSYLDGGLIAVVLAEDTSAKSKLDALQAFFLSWGAWAPVAYILFVTAEVVIAPLPGLMLYAPGGVIFGGFLGGLYSLLGNLIGAAIACQVMRVVGRSLFGPSIRQSLSSLEKLIDKRGMWIVFFLRINPFTSSDLVSYAAGLTGMPTWKLLLGTAFGMAPLCWLQAYLADGLLAAFPGLVYPLALACAVYTLVLVWTLRQIARKQGRAAD